MVHSSDLWPDAFSFYHTELFEKGDNYRYHLTTDAISGEIFQSESGLSTYKRHLNLGGMTNTASGM